MITFEYIGTFGYDYLWLFLNTSVDFIVITYEFMTALEYIGRFD